LSQTATSLSASAAALPRNAHWPTISLLLAAFTWTFWSTFASLIKDWRTDDNYSVGALVPFAALYLLWADRHRLAYIPLAPCWWGVPLILLGFLSRFLGLVYLFESAERFGMLLAFIGLVVLLAGAAVASKLKWLLFFLFLMFPLPGKIHNLISGPLQTFATKGAVFGLELFGVTVAREGNRLVLNDQTPLAVAEACSGLRMLTAFIVVAYAFAYLVERPAWQKVTLVLSSIPIAIFCNIIRLDVTAALFLFTNSELAEVFFHDFAGLTMMPLAVILLFSELWILNKLLLPDDR